MKIRKPRPKKFYSKEIFGAELAKILAARQISQDEFNKELNVQQAVTRWKNGETTPSADSLLAIKRTFGVSIDQLLTGQTEAPGLQEFVPEPYEARPPMPTNATLMGEILGLVKRVIKEEKQRLTDDQEGRLVARIYDQCAEEKNKPDIIMIKRYLLLTD